MTLLQRISFAAIALLAPSAFGQFVISGSMPDGVVGQSYSGALSSTGSTATRWSFLGNFPPGLSLNGQGPNASVTGTPTTPGSFSFTIQAQDPDQNNLTASKSFTVNITGKLAILTSVVFPNGVVNQSYTLQMTAAGGTPSYTWALAPSAAAPNALPAGLSITPGGLISGTPTAAGNYGFDIMVTDNAKNTLAQFFSLIIQPPLNISTPSPLPTGTVNTTYSQALTTTGGTSPYTYSIVDPANAPPGMVVNSTGLGGVPKSTGSFTFTVQVMDSLQYTATKQFQVSIAPVGPLLQTPNRSLIFTAFTGGDTPPVQTIPITAPSGFPVNYAVAVDSGTAGTAAPSWITVAPTGGPAPGALIVSVSQAGLQTGKYPATIHITVPNNASQAPIDISVIFTISTGSLQLTSLPATLQFAARAANPLALDQMVIIANAGGGGAFSFNAAVVGKSSWISNVTPPSARIGPNAPAAVRVFVNSQGLKPGFYHDILRITSPTGSLDVPITLFVSDQGPILGLTASGLRFEMRAGAGSSQTQTVNVLNLGDASTTAVWKVDLVTGSDWLTVGNPNGNATPLRPGTFTLTPGPGAANLSPGGHYALVRVSDPGAINSPQYLVVVADVSSPDSAPTPIPSTGGLLFTSNTPAQTVLIYTSSAAQTAFQTSVFTADGNPWLSATPTTGNASTAAPGKISVSVNSGGVGPGVYFGYVHIAMNGTLHTVRVTLIVTASSTFSVANAAGCTGSRLVITQTGLVDNFTVPAGWPATLIVQLNDDCGSAVSNGTVVATFSNGDPPVTLKGDFATNLYSATWQPAAISSEMTITVRAVSSTLATTTAQYTGSVNHNATPPPTLVPNGALHIFFSAPMAAALGAGLAPGNVAQVYGTGMAASPSPTVVPLPNEFSGTFMLIGGTEAPLFYISDGLINVQVPFELTSNRQYSAIVSANGALTLPETINITPLQPGVAQFPDGTVIAQVSGTTTLISASNPATPGQNLTIYLAGMGPTNPAVPSGQPTPLQLVPATNQPTVTLDGQTVNYAYAGLTPTGVGLYQINLTVPANIRSGNLDLVVTQNGVAANTTKLPVAGNQ